MGKYQIFLSTFGKKVLRMSNAVPIEVGAVFRTGGGILPVMTKEIIFHERILSMEN